MTTHFPHPAPKTCMSCSVFTNYYCDCLSSVGNALRGVPQSGKPRESAVHGTPRRAFPTVLCPFAIELKQSNYWQALYQQNPQAEGSAEWPDRWRCKAVALDPSKGTESKFGDYSAFALLMVDREGVLYVDADLAIRNTSVIVDTAIELQRSFQPDWFGVETNQFQQLLADDLVRRSGEHGVLLPLFTIQNNVNKLVRIRRLTPYLSQGRIRFKIVRLACCCGLRASEITELRLRDVVVGVERPHLRIGAAGVKGRKRRTVPLWWDAGTLADISGWKQFRESCGDVPFEHAFYGSAATLGSPTSARTRIKLAVFAPAISTRQPLQGHLRPSRFHVDSVPPR